MKGSSNVANALGEATRNPAAGKWSKVLLNAAQGCVPKIDERDTLRQAWADLSNHVRGFPWSGPEVRIHSSLSQRKTCIVKELCRAMGLRTDS